MQTVIILLGAPGSGKRTVAEGLSKSKGIAHISIGDLFYDNINSKTALGLQAQRFLEKGQLVPDNLVLDILFDRLSEADCQNGYILDGIPKDIAQVHELEDFLRNKAQVTAILLKVADDIVTSRLAKRFICDKCHHVYNAEYVVPRQEGICDLCGGTLTHRNNDTPDIVKERLKVYHEQTEPLEKYYKEQGLLKEVDGSKPLDQVLTDILACL